MKPSLDLIVLAMPRQIPFVEIPIFVNDRCGVTAKEADAKTSYSWGDIYEEMTRQGYRPRPSVHGTPRSSVIYTKETR